MKLFFVVGTRPEGIKLAPLIIEAKKHSSFQVEVCITGQHKEMLYQVLDLFEIKPDYDLALMEANQTLSRLTSKAIDALDKVIKPSQPDYIFVQGDTTTAFVGALVGFYNKVKVVHVEAGLRSFDKYSPFPEEINRKLISSIAEFHFAPTPQAAMNLELEGISRNLYTVGNTVIDALLLCNKIINDREIGVELATRYSQIPFADKKVILMTCHRRENFGDPLQQILRAVRDLANENEDIHFVYPVHLNPNVLGPAKEWLGGISNVTLLEPLDYHSLVWMIGQSYMVLTDSGGIQEEAPSLGKPVLVMREVTERQEGVEAGTAKLVGTVYSNIVASVVELLRDKAAYEKMAQARNPYGDGTTSYTILNTLIGKKNLVTEDAI
jgi:UDP-N-acetylglucosamine 2-epimerase (non-hydrolysing)